MKSERLLFLIFLGAALLLLPALSAAERGGGERGSGYGQLERESSREFEKERERERHEERVGNDPDDGQQHRDTLRERKTEQEMKELGQGSDQGQRSREEHRRKWWRFWE